MFLLGFAIELVGRHIMQWWHYPYIDSVWREMLLQLFYPFILMSFNDMFILVQKYTSRLALPLSMLLGIMIWKMPNAWSSDWVYTAPLPQLSILGLPVVIVFGWALLIWLPRCVRTVIGNS